LTRLFDPAWGVAFSNYAVPTIESYVLRFLALEKRQARLPTVALEMPLGNGGDGGRLEDVVADPQAETPGAALLERDGFEQMLAPLRPPHRAVLRPLYADGQTMEEVGLARGVTKQRIEQIHKEALRRLPRAVSRLLRRCG
jgi:RNA polymerase sigma factor (sigma-70 family)